jgi:hypothetical protein
MDLVRKGRPTLLLAVTGIAFGTVAPAGAEDPVSAPTACGQIREDKAGDQVIYPTPFVGLTAQAMKGPDNMDARRYWFALDKTADGKPRVTVNIQVTNLNNDVAPEVRLGNVRYMVEMTTTGDVGWVAAFNKKGTWSFAYGAAQRVPASVPQAGGTSVLLMETATTGRLFPGPDGVIQIDVPLDPALIRDGLVFKGSYLDIYPDSGNSYYSDRLPDDGVAADMKATECTVAPTPSPEATPTASAEPTATPPSDPPQQAPQPRPAPQPQPAPHQSVARQPLTKLPIKAAASLGSATKARKGVRVKVSSTRTITDLVVQVRKGKTVIAAGRMKRLNGTASLQLKVKTGRLKAGKYRLEAIGLVDGESLRYSRAVGLKK